MTTGPDKPFPVVDYVVFGVLCTSSCLGGIYYGARGARTKNVKNVKDYLLGGKNMDTFPVALSLIASYVSGVTILGTPAEIYNYGTQYWLILIAVCASALIVSTVYLPVFCTLRLLSSYEYLELRFNKHVRAVASILFLMDEVMFLPMVIYVPALAFNQLTGFNVYGISVIMICITGLYTVLGGLKAVVWTDAVQTCIMIISVIIISVAGTMYIGSMGSVVDICSRNNRFDLTNWNVSAYERQSGWAVIIGGTVYWTAFNSVNQTMVQRYISLPSKAKAMKALAIFCLGAVMAITLCIWCGLLAFSSWVQRGCDKAGAPLVNDRLLPSFVMHVSRNYQLPGLGGLFLAGVFGAGLSSLSAVLNACALVAIEDLLHGWLEKKLQPIVEGIIARVLTAALAVSSVLMLFVISRLGGVLGVAAALTAIAASTSCGIFTLGMVFPWVGPRGALAGGLAGALVAGTVSLGTQGAAAKGLRFPALPLEAQCAANASFAPTSVIDPETVFPLFRVSYHWIAPMGLFTTLFVGAIVGWCCDKTDLSKFDIEVYTPLIWRWLPLEFHHRRGSVRMIHPQLSEIDSSLSPEQQKLLIQEIRQGRASLDEKGKILKSPSNLTNRLSENKENEDKKSLTNFIFRRESKETPMSTKSLHKSESKEKAEKSEPSDN